MKIIPVVRCQSKIERCFSGRRRGSEDLTHLPFCPPLRMTDPRTLRASDGLPMFASFGAQAVFPKLGTSEFPAIFVRLLISCASQGAAVVFASGDER